MKIKSILTILVISILYSCGSKKASFNKEELIKDVSTYVSEVDNNQQLKKEVTEGSLSDAGGFKDIGTFRYTVFFDDKTRALFKIENIEMTNQTINETFYFHENELVFISSVSDKNKKKVYLKNNKVISKSNMEHAELKLLLDKAKRFKKSF